MQEFILGLLAKTLKMPKDELKSLLYDEDSGELQENALETALDLDVKRIDSLTERHKTEKDDQYKRATREQKEKAEKLLKETFDLTDVDGLESMVDAIKDLKAGSGSGNNSLTDEDVKKHPIYRDLLREKSDSEKKLNEDWQTKVNEVEQGFSSKFMRSRVDEKAIDIAKSLNLVLSKDPERASRQLKTITKELDGFTFEEIDGKINVLKDGKQYVDERQHLVEFNDLVTGIATSFFDIDESDADANQGGKGSGNKNKFGENKNLKVKVPTSEEELKTAINDAKSSEEREAIAKAYYETSGENE